MRTCLTLLILTGLFLATTEVAHADLILLNQPKTPESQPDYSAAIDALKNGKLDLCRQSLRLELEKYPDSSHPEVLLAGLLIEAEQVAAAKQILSELLLSPSSLHEAHFALGRIAAVEKRWADAWAHIRIAEIETLPTRWSTDYAQEVQRSLRELKATVALARRDWNVAKPLLEEMNREEPENHAVLRSLAGLYFQKGKLDLSRVAFEKAAELDSQDQLPYQVRLARLHISKGEFDTAEKLLKTSVRSDGVGGQLARLAYADLLINDNRPAEADHQLSLAEWEPTLQKRRSVLLGMAYRMQHAFEKAEEIFTRLHQSDATNVSYSNQLALVLIESLDEGKRARALQIANTNVGRIQSEATISTLAWIQYRLGDIQAAADLFVRLTNSTQLSPDSAYYFSEILRAGGHIHEANKLRKLAQNARGPRFFTVAP